MIRPLLAALLLAFVPLAVATAPDGPPTDGGGGAPRDALAPLAWMAGCWARVTEASRLEEQWMEPRGGLMLGMSRLVRDGRAVSHEALRIEDRGGTVVYVAWPSGQAVTEFAAAAIDDTLAVFENPEHDFPQRILYLRGPGDSLHARIEGERGGQVRGVDFRMGRAPCPEGPER